MIPKCWVYWYLAHLRHEGLVGDSLLVLDICPAELVVVVVRHNVTSEYGKAAAELSLVRRAMVGLLTHRLHRRKNAC